MRDFLMLQPICQRRDPKPVKSKALQFLGGKLQYLRHLRQWLSCIWAPSTSRTKV